MTGRGVVSLLVWLSCVPGMFVHGTMGTALFGMQLADLAWPPSWQSVWLLCAVLASLAAWPMLGVLNLCWLENRPLHWRWPLIGTLLATCWMLPHGWIFALFVAPGVLFASYLCVWHLLGWRRAQRSPAAPSRADPELPVDAP